MPNTPKGGGISRKIFNSGDRKKISTILNEISIPKEMGLIVRTAGSNKTKRDIELLVYSFWGITFKQFLILDVSKPKISRSTRTF